MKTNMASSYTSSPRYINDTDYDDIDSLDLDDDRDFENFTDEGKDKIQTANICLQYVCEYALAPSMQQAFVCSLFRYLIVRVFYVFVIVFIHI